MIPNQILRVLSTLQKNQVRFLLMGGQACVLYGGVEFSRDMERPTPERIRFWLNEMRSPELLVDVVKQFPEEASAAAMGRPAVASAIVGDLDGIQTSLDEEVARERALDREYWAPLRKELEQLRRDRSRG